jgi:maleate cis-trans isomerase
VPPHSLALDILNMKKIPTIGFISAPAWFDPAPSEFPTVVEEEVHTQQAPLLLPEFDYRLESIASVQNELNLCARSLKAIGCDLVAQVGSPFAWACASSETEARSRRDVMTESAKVPSIMTSLAIVDGLRSHGAKRVAVNCTYYESDWRDAFAFFLRNCGFETTHVSTLADQGLAAVGSKMEDYGWSMTDELTSQSILAVANASPSADAIVVTGAGTRTLKILSDLESEIKRPIIAADTIIYWAIANELNLTLKPVMGTLANIRKRLSNN